MSRIDDIRELARLGAQHLHQLQSGDWEQSVDTWHQYTAAFDTIRRSAIETELTLPERVALRQVGEVHDRTERLISNLATETRDMLAKLRSAERISGYAPVSRSDRSPRYLDASA